MTKQNEITIVILITILGGILRFTNLGTNPLWIDEAWFGFLARDNFITQEFIPAYFIKITGFYSDFQIRFFSALCGTLSIPAMYYIAKNFKLTSSLLVAVFPLFVFWSRMARPYAPAGLFLILSWKWWYMMIPAILTTPIALVGLKIIKQNKYVLSGFIIGAIVFYLIREDSSRGWTFQQFLTSPRWWYLPILTSILYVTEYFGYFNKKRESHVNKKTKKRHIK